MSSNATRPYRQTARAEAADELRSRILRAFLDALKTGWLVDITLDDVAAAARTTRQTVIRLFGGKEGLLKAAVAVWPAEVEALAAAMVGMWRNSATCISGCFVSHRATPISSTLSNSAGPDTGDGSRTR